MYYYKEIGEERELEFNKIYEFIWVFKNNLSLYELKQCKRHQNAKASVKSVNKVNKRLNKSLSRLIDQRAFYKADKKFESFKRDNYTFTITTKILGVVKLQNTNI